MDMVIGVGNPLCSDDGIGARVVERLPRRPSLQMITVHQLVPELAEQLHVVDRVLFVDARLDGATRLERIEPATHRGLGHACTPGALLEWTRLAFGRAPAAWLLSVPGASFALGETLSAEGADRLAEALERARVWIEAPGEASVEMEEEA